MNLRSSLAALAALAMCAVLADAQAQAGAPFELVTAAERQAELQAQARQPPQAPRTRSLPMPRPNAPTIRVLAPSQASAVTAPLRIELAFEPMPGARIVPASFRVLYGVLKIDLTERLRRHATVSESGVVVEQAQMPDGLHRLYMQVADDQGNQGEQELRLRVGVGS